MAAGKPIFCNAQIGYSLLTKYHCGFHATDVSENSIKIALKNYFSLSEEEQTQMGKNAYRAAQDFDSVKLSRKLISIIEKLLNE